MLTNQACPICLSKLQEQQVAPCYECGHETRELDEYRQGYHKYNLFSIWDEELVLCDFCDADFDSYYPEYFGLKKDVHIEYPLKFVSEVEKPALSIDLYCPTCKHRLVFLEFIAKVRRKNSV